MIWVMSKWPSRLVIVYFLTLSEQGTIDLVSPSTSPINQSAVFCQVSGMNYEQRKSTFKQHISRCDEEKKHLCPYCDRASHSKQPKHPSRSAWEGERGVYLGKTSKSYPNIAVGGTALHREEQVGSSTNGTIDLVSPTYRLSYLRKNWCGKHTTTHW